MASSKRGRAGVRSRERGPLRAVSAATADHLTVHVGDRLRQLREEHELTQEEAAAKAGVTRNTLVNLEREQFPNPQLSTLLGLMRCYRLTSLDALLGPMPATWVAEAWKQAGWPNTRHRRARD